MHVEDDLRQIRNPLWVDCYDNPAKRQIKRLSLTMQTLRTEDHDCMQAFANAFQNPRAGFMDHIYWNDLESTMKMGAQRIQKKQTEANEPECSACSGISWLHIFCLGCNLTERLLLAVYDLPSPVVIIELPLHSMCTPSPPR